MHELGAGPISSSEYIHPRRLCDGDVHAEGLLGNVSGDNTYRKVMEAELGRVRS